MPDGVVSQSAFTLYMETKNFDWFSDDQLERHLESLGDETADKKILIALSNFESGIERFHEVEKICDRIRKTRHKEQLFFKAVSFEDFLDALPEENISPTSTPS